MTAVLALAAILAFPLEDGTTVLVASDARAPLVTVVVEFSAGTWSPWVRARDAEEAFEIQLHDPSGELKRRADALAAEVSLSMGGRAAWLRATCLAEDLEAVAGLLREILGNEAFDRRELRSWSDGARLARGLDERDPRWRLRLEAARRLLPPEDPRRATLEERPRVSTDVRALVAARDAFVRIPGRVVGFAGDVSPDDARRIAASLLPPPVARVPHDLDPVLAIPEGGGGEGVVPMRRLTQTYFAWVRPSLSWIDRDAPAFEIADHVLAGHFHSRLYEALRHEGGETYGVRSSDTGDVAPGIYAIETFTRKENAAATEAKLLAALRKFQEEGITEEERAAAASHLVGRRAFARQSPEQLLFTRLEERRLGLPEGFHDRRAERAAEVPLEEVNAFIRRFYDPSRFERLRAE